MELIQAFEETKVFFLTYKHVGENILLKSSVSNISAGHINFLENGIRKDLKICSNYCYSTVNFQAYPARDLFIIFGKHNLFHTH